MNGQTVRVKRYYEANTRWMLARGVGRGEAVIHRPLWLPGVSGRRQAVHAVDALIRDTLQGGPAPLRPAEARRLRLLDLGCGAGGTAVWLADRLAAEVTGITLSPAQVERARALARERGMAERCRFVEGDFLDERALVSLENPAGAGGFDAAYAVEAFSHAADPGVFFARAAALLPRRGLLILCDDFPDDSSAGRRDRRERWLGAFRQGWHLGPLLGEGQALAEARAHGLELISRRDLSPYLRGRYGWARVSHGLLSLLPGRGPWISSQRGGAALQVCLRRRWVRYLYLVLRKG